MCSASHLPAPKSVVRGKPHEAALSTMKRGLSGSDSRPTATLGVGWPSLSSSSSFQTYGLDKDLGGWGGSYLEAAITSPQRAVGSSLRASS